MGFYVCSIDSDDGGDGGILCLCPHLLTLHPGALWVALAVEDDEVGVGAGAERTLPALDAEALGGVVGRALDGLAERAASEAGEVADTLVECADTTWDEG